MYEILVKTTENELTSKPFQTIVTIKAAVKEAEEQLGQLLKEDYYVRTYLNPIFWLLNFSPMIVYVSKYQCEMDAHNQLLQLNKEMVFSFKRKHQCKYFARVIVKVLTKFMEKRLAESEQDRCTFHAQELISH